MDNNELLKPLQEILERAEALLDLAEAQQWEELDAAASNYQQHVTFLNDDVYLKAIQDAALVDEAKALIAKIQVMNDDLNAHTTLQRDKIASELRQIVQSGKALNAYGQ
ncbi:MAG: flagellar protein FliT [Gammaproteobacteria bacterium]|nr:MAG: flagellar protein FliT [Gammaproteobacteria bacterium]